MSENVQDEVPGNALPDQVPAADAAAAIKKSSTPALQPALPVLPGMNGTVEIRTGERSVLAFMLLPMLKSQEAFRER